MGSEEDTKRKFIITQKKKYDIIWQTHSKRPGT